MKTGKHNLRDWFTHHQLDQVIIPAIQRDYVWPNSHVEALLRSMNEDALKMEELAVAPEVLAQMSERARLQFVRSLEENKPFTNIGFIYAYQDAEYHGKYFLIDGQQRFTTMFLLLLALCVGENRGEYFRRTYFSTSGPKLDFKVRENTRTFWVQFLDFLIEGGSAEEVKDQYWYLKAYDRDPSIDKIISNYRMIGRCLDHGDFPALTLDFVEKQVEFWYFDTTNSKQGEELYLYMNSRGEAVSSNENVKAQLLRQKSSAEEKAEWGSKWEDWQQFFWKYKGNAATADPGFNALLKWIQIIRAVKEGFKINEIRSLYDHPGPDMRHIEWLQLEDIEAYQEALVKMTALIVRNVNYKAIFQSGIGDSQQIALFRILPLLAFLRSFPDAYDEQIVRFARFFFNLSRLPRIAGDPILALLRAMSLTLKMINLGEKDVVALAQVDANHKDGRFLPNEEVFKLRLYAPPFNHTRDALEEIFWEAEDHELLNGRIEPVLSWMSLSVDDDKMETACKDFDGEKFRRYYQSFRRLSRSKDKDIFRRALLTFGDYTIRDGYSTSLDGERYSLIHLKREWLEVLHDQDKRSSRNILGEMIFAFLSKGNWQDGTPVVGKFYEDQIASYINQEAVDKDWRYYFIKYPQVMEYCQQKYFVKSSSRIDWVYLLEKKRAYYYASLPDFLKGKKLSI